MEEGLQRCRRLFLFLNQFKYLLLSSLHGLKFIGVLIFGF